MPQYLKIMVTFPTQDINDKAFWSLHSKPTEGRYHRYLQEEPTQAEHASPTYEGAFGYYPFYEVDDVKKEDIDLEQSEKLSTNLRVTATTRGFKPSEIRAYIAKDGTRTPNPFYGKPEPVVEESESKTAGMKC